MLLKAFGRTIIVIGIGVVTLMLLWSASTQTAEASGLHYPAVSVDPVVPAAGQAEAPARGAWLELPTRLPSLHRKEDPLCRDRGRKQKQTRRGRKGGRIRLARLTERTRETDHEAIRPAMAFQPSVQRPKRSLSAGDVASTTTVNVEVMPLTVCIPKPIVGSVTGSVGPTGVTASGVASGRLGGWVSVNTAPLMVAGQVCAEDVACQSWVADEMRALDLGDKRLNRRAGRLVEQFAARSTASIPGACGTWANSKAAYRFFDNPRVTHAAVLAGHRPACLARIQPERLILAVQDTTSLNYTPHPHTQGLGTLDNTQGLGLMVHTSLAACLPPACASACASACAYTQTGTRRQVHADRQAGQ